MELKRSLLSSFIGLRYFGCFGLKVNISALENVAHFELLLGAYK
jgi:hypothetical protein